MLKSRALDKVQHFIVVYEKNRSRHNNGSNSVVAIQNCKDDKTVEKNELKGVRPLKRA